MSQNRVTPGWGKAIGILMIVFGGLGVFYQFYKIMIPQMLAMSNRMTGIMAEMEVPDQPNPFRNSQELFGEMMQITPMQSQVMVWSGILGIILCAVYIVAGAKLLKATPFNYKFARAALISFLFLNLFTVILLFTDDVSLMLLGMLFYIIFGLLIDLVLAIILMASNKKKYGIGVDPNEVVYSLDSDNPEVL